MKRNPHDWPSLNRWLYSIGLTDELIQQKFFYSALVNYFPGAKNGSHVVPTKEEIKKEKDRLKKDIVRFKPDIIVTVGKLSASYCLGREVLLTDVIGQAFFADPYEFLQQTVTINWFQNQFHKASFSFATSLKDEF